ncbi:PHP domain [Chromobacterium violaceum]|uniref:PHP domain n=1 Tax=Chromobacterium violaceum TaxID=536 RepID=A0A447TAR0_CHRVL|nr:PHP domain [Chromobacterium violaceum]
MANIDLHFHSRTSDGALTPTEVIDRAAARAPALLALTDHDCTGGWPRRPRPPRGAAYLFSTAWKCR